MKGRDMRQLRKKAKVNQVDVLAELGWSPNRLVDYELERTQLSADLEQDLLDAIRKLAKKPVSA